MQEMPPSKEDIGRGETTIALVESKKDRNGTTKQKDKYMKLDQDDVRANTDYDNHNVA